MIEFPSPGWLKPAYLLNILILIPVCFTTFFGNGLGGVFENKVEDSLGLRLLVGSLWCAILVGSIVGLFQPGFFAPIIMVQVFYKALWLLGFVVPAFQKGGWEAVPIGISATFVFIVVTYPILLVLAARG